MNYRKATLRRQMGVYIFQDPQPAVADGTHTLSDVTSLTGAMTNFYDRGQITKTGDTHMSVNYMRGSSRLYKKLI